MGRIAMLYCGEEMWRSWGALAHSVRAGEPSLELVFFRSVPTADAHVMTSVLHDWDDARCVDILTTVRAAMPQRGTLFVVEPTLPDDPAEPHREQVTLMNDLTMLVGTGGRERTVNDFEKLLAAAGLRLVSGTPGSGR